MELLTQLPQHWGWGNDFEQILEADVALAVRKRFVSAG